MNFSPRDWEIGIAVSLPGRGTAIEGLVTVRPWSVAIFLGPLTIECEGEGRIDVETEGKAAEDLRSMVRLQREEMGTDPRDMRIYWPPDGIGYRPGKGLVEPRP